MDPELRTWRVDDGAGARPRLDVYLAQRDAGLTRARVHRLVDQGCVTVNGALPSKAGARLHPGDRIVVTLRPAVEVVLVPEPMDLRILYEDPHLVVVDKPAGLVVHPAPGNPTGTLIHGLLARGTFADRSGPLGERPGVVHRLDKDTSGVMVVARDARSEAVLSRAFRAKTDVLREYLAICAPAPEADSGTIRTSYDRHPGDPRKFSSRVDDGKPAVTHWEVVERLAHGAARIRCRLETGRTHQIRVHLGDNGWPIVGDPLYGRAYPGVLGALAIRLGRQALHAARLELDHPITGERLRFWTDPPADLRVLREALSPAG
jgi:23S rRNA pseudouridine1911/1915/1917 synthase